ncbi:glycosyltransferase family 4 protein [Fluviicola sp.]|uniref:glycosyltransferase family 4 protein n=1 Tax=Fluviicola sp. TaxID=1917219 RepID=UPI00262637A1|nr:glycosyltransferase family 4 protein [Fluviicola sp.]
MQLCYIISDINKAVYFEQTAWHLRAQNLDVCYILINSTQGELHRFLSDNQFTVYTLESGSLLKSRKIILACKKILKEQRITHIHCHLAQANWIGLWAAKLAKINTRIYTRHSGEPLNPHWKERFIDRIQNKLATRIVAISKNIDDLLEKQGVPLEKRVLIHHGFELERFAHPQNEEVLRIKNAYNPENQFPVVGVISRWLELKGIQYILDAFQRLLKTHPDALLCLFGASDNADYSKEIKELVQTIPQRNIRVVGFENNVFDLYQLFDMYIHVPVNPSCEAFGQTYVEALAAGIPSIFTLSGVAREFIVDQENALIVPFRDAASIHQTLLLLLSDQTLPEKLKLKGPESVREMFSFTRYIAQLNELYTD